jgi:hypothetical protein
MGRWQFLDPGPLDTILLGVAAVVGLLLLVFYLVARKRKPKGKAKEKKD